MQMLITQTVFKGAAVSVSLNIMKMAEKTNKCVMPDM
jgi:hypothetical protein